MFKDCITGEAALENILKDPTRGVATLAIMAKTEEQLYMAKANILTKTFYYSSAADVSMIVFETACIDPTYQLHFIVVNGEKSGLQVSALLYNTCEETYLPLLSDDAEADIYQRYITKSVKGKFMETDVIKTMYENIQNKNIVNESITLYNTHEVITPSGYKYSFKDTVLKNLLMFDCVNKFSLKSFKRQSSLIYGRENITSFSKDVLFSSTTSTKSFMKDLYRFTCLCSDTIKCEVLTPTTGLLKTSLRDTDSTEGLSTPNPYDLTSTTNYPF